MEEIEIGPRLVPEGQKKPWFDRKVIAFSESPLGERLRASTQVRTFTQSRFVMWFDAHARDSAQLVISIAVLYLLVALTHVALTYVIKRGEVRFDGTTVALLESGPATPRAVLLEKLALVAPTLANPATNDRSSGTELYQIKGTIVDVPTGESPVLAVHVDEVDHLFEFGVSEETHFMHNDEEIASPQVLQPGFPVLVMTTGTVLEGFQNITHPLLDAVEVVSTSRTETLVDVPVY